MSMLIDDENIVIQFHKKHIYRGLQWLIMLWMAELLWNNYFIGGH